jgi:Transposase
VTRPTREFPGPPPVHRHCRRQPWPASGATARLEIETIIRVRVLSPMSRAPRSTLPSTARQVMLASPREDRNPEAARERRFAADLCRAHGISSGTFYKWKAKFSGLEVSGARRSVEHAIAACARAMLVAKPVRIIASGRPELKRPSAGNQRKGAPVPGADQGTGSWCSGANAMRRGGNSGFVRDPIAALPHRSSDFSAGLAFARPCR